MCTKVIGWGYEAIGSLLDDVEAEGGVVPEKYKPDAPGDYSLESLRKQDSVRNERLTAGQKISMAFTLESILPELKSNTLAARRPKIAGDAQRYIELSLKKIENDEVFSHLLQPYLRHEPNSSYSPSVHEIIIEMKRLSEALRDYRNASCDKAPFPDIEKTEQGILFERLAKAYEEIFGQNAVSDIKKNGEKYHGPFVAFVNASFRLSGRPLLSNSAIGLALRRHIKS